jgi:hypothetical protein
VFQSVLSQAYTTDKTCFDTYLNVVVTCFFLHTALSHASWALCRCHVYVCVSVCLCLSVCVHLFPISPYLSLISYVSLPLFSCRPPYSFVEIPMLTRWFRCEIFSSSRNWCFLNLNPLPWKIKSHFRNWEAEKDTEEVKRQMGYSEVNGKDNWDTCSVAMLLRRQTEEEFSSRGVPLAPPLCESRLTWEHMLHMRPQHAESKKYLRKRAQQPPSARIQGHTIVFHSFYHSFWTFYYTHVGTMTTCAKFFFFQLILNLSAFFSRTFRCGHLLRYINMNP